MGIKKQLWIILLVCCISFMLISVSNAYWTTQKQVQGTATLTKEISIPLTKDVVIEKPKEKVEEKEGKEKKSKEDSMKIEDESDRSVSSEELESKPLITEDIEKLDESSEDLITDETKDVNPKDSDAVDSVAENSINMENNIVENQLEPSQDKSEDSDQSESEIKNENEEAKASESEIDLQIEDISIQQQITESIASDIVEAEETNTVGENVISADQQGSDLSQDKTKQKETESN